MMSLSIPRRPDDELTGGEKDKTPGYEDSPLREL